MINTSSNSKEFYESKRLFCLAFVQMLKKMGAAHTKQQLRSVFDESTFLLFDDNLTAKNIEATVMEFEKEDIHFK